MVTSWITNKYRHLVNNSIGKTSSNFHKTFTVELTGNTVHGYMWTLASFQDWLQKRTGENKWESLQKEIQHIVIDSILCAQEDIVPGSRHAFEIYGFDIMIDANLRPWLIEINSSPACDYSTAVTESFVKRALPDVLKVIFPNKQNPAEKIQDTGGWKQIYQGPFIPKIPVRLGFDLTLKGCPVVVQKYDSKEHQQRVRSTSIKSNCATTYPIQEKQNNSDQRAPLIPIDSAKGNNVSTTQLLSGGEETTPNKNIMKLGNFNYYKENKYPPSKVKAKQKQERVHVQLTPVLLEMKLEKC